MNRRQFMATAGAAFMGARITSEAKPKVPEFKPEVLERTLPVGVYLGQRHTIGDKTFIWCQCKGPCKVNVGDVVMSDQVGTQ